MQKQNPMTLRNNSHPLKSESNQSLPKKPAENRLKKTALLNFTNFPKT